MPPSHVHNQLTVVRASFFCKTGVRPGNTVTSTVSVKGTAQWYAEEAVCPRNKWLQAQPPGPDCKSGQKIRVVRLSVDDASLQPLRNSRSF